MVNLPHSTTPPETAMILAENFRDLRLHDGLKRSTLARQAGVSEASLKRFENTGQVSLKNLLRLAYAMNRLHEFTGLFALPQASSLAELREQSVLKKVKRGTR